MGWLFGKKKKNSAVPKPVRKFGEQHALNLPTKTSAPKEQPSFDLEDFKKAAGVSYPKPRPAAPMPVRQTALVEEPMPEHSEPSIQSAPKVAIKRPVNYGEPVFLKVESYKRILGELDEIKAELADLADINRHLEKSEYNEERSFSNLQTSIKNIHDKFLSVDEIVFKS